MDPDPYSELRIRICKAHLIMDPSNPEPEHWSRGSDWHYFLIYNEMISHVSKKKFSLSMTLHPIHYKGVDCRHKLYRV